MGWPYEFLTLTDEEKALRRESLTYYGAIAHLSAWTPALLFFVVRLSAKLYQRFSGGRQIEDGAYEAVPGSPAVKALRENAGGLEGLKARWRKMVWWMGDEVLFRGQRWGTREDWAVGGTWMAWLLVLCVLGTGKDYLHLTKRFGLIAASQFPIQYLLSLKPLNPFTLLLDSSHERLNRYHRILGRVVYALLWLHLLFYNAFFVLSGIWLKKMGEPVVIYGVVSSLALHALVLTAIASVRNSSYRLFYRTHVIVAGLVMIPLLFLHAPSMRVYLLEAWVVFAADLVLRLHRNTVYHAPSTLEPIHGTNLVKITASLPPRRLPTFISHPASHVFLQIPGDSPSSTSKNFVSSVVSSRNPFTVTSIDATSNTITLIARTRSGPLTSRLSLFSATASHTNAQTPIPLSIQGPYPGIISRSLPSICAHDRILLFAGGVGATFTLPVYRAIVSENPAARVKLIWAVRSAAEATWATTSTSPSTSSGSASVLDDNNVQLFLTGDMGMNASNSSNGVELSDLRRGNNKKRPDVGRIVDDTFRRGLEESVAVVVCGPEGMVRDVRTRVRSWVMKGRRVWWHNETFGY